MNQHFLNFDNTNEKVKIDVRFTPTIGMTFPFNGIMYIVTEVNINTNETNIKLVKLNHGITGAKWAKMTN